MMKIALDVGFMITTMSGQDTNKMMPSSDVGTLEKFAKAISALSKPVSGEGMEEIIDRSIYIDEHADEVSVSKKRSWINIRGKIYQVDVKRIAQALTEAGYGRVDNPINRIEFVYGKEGV